MIGVSAPYSAPATAPASPIRHVFAIFANPAAGNGAVNAISHPARRAERCSFDICIEPPSVSPATVSSLPSVSSCFAMFFAHFPSPGVTRSRPSPIFWFAYPRTLPIIRGACSPARIAPIPNSPIFAHNESPAEGASCRDGSETFLGWAAFAFCSNLFLSPV